MPFSASELEPTLRPLAEAWQLPPRAFTDEAVAEWELEHLFLGGWACAGHAGALDGRGAFVVRQLGGESFFVVAGEDGAPRAFFNVCRHRGARLLSEPEGRVRRLQCPYHAWSYGFDGVLQTPPDERFDPACFSLRELRSEVLQGLVFVDVSGTAPALSEHVGALAARLERHRLGELRRAATITYEVAANWKAIVQNYSECLHCPGVHPELNRLTHYLSGVDHEGPGAWCGGAMTLNEGVATIGRGRGGGWPAIAGAGEREVLYYALLPNTLISLHPDYAMLHTLWPRGAGRTEIVCEWFFEATTMAAPGFDPADAVDFWDTVNRQDWRVCELTQQGVGSRGFSRGRYTTNEHTVHRFDRMVCEAYLGAFGAGSGAGTGDDHEADRHEVAGPEGLA